MDDLISRQQAIDAVKKNTFRLTFAEEQNCEGHVAWSANAAYSDVIEGALLELPTAQPEPHEECTETHACDLIDRQALMKEFSDFVRASNNSDFARTPTWNDAVSLVGSMPSAQPAPCEFCKHNNIADDKACLMCSAERRTDE